MRRFLLLILLSLPVTAPAATPGPLATCREFAELSETVFIRRDQGVTQAAQEADWEKIIAGKKNAPISRGLMANILTYAYSPKARSVSPKQAKSEYFKGCRASTASPAG
jgi:hypothetical protein